MLSITEHWQLIEWHVAELWGKHAVQNRGSSTALLLTNMEIYEIGALTVDKFVQLFVINIRTL